MMQNSILGSSLEPFLESFIDAVNKNDITCAQSILTNHPEIVGKIFPSAGVNTTVLNVILRKMYSMRFVQRR